MAKRLPVGAIDLPSGKGIGFVQTYYGMEELVPAVDGRIVATLGKQGDKVAKGEIVAFVEGSADAAGAADDAGAAGSAGAADDAGAAGSAGAADDAGVAGSVGAAGDAGAAGSDGAADAAAK